MAPQTLRRRAPNRTHKVPAWEVVARDASGREHRHLLQGNGTLRCGSHPAADVVLDDPTVSRLHAELSVEEGGVRLRDLGSTNGCTVGPLRVLDVVLPDGATAALGQSRLQVRAHAPASEPLHGAPRFGPLVGGSAVMRALFETLQKVAASPATVLVEAESGCGKELVARAVHEASPRRAGPLVVFDAAAVAPALVESALFGHEKGAFTGAVGRTVGCFEEADGGTLFIDELGELPLELQPRLLRALESREVRRVGGNEAVPVDVRIVAATNRDLAREVNEGTFREDLYYRLAVVRVRVPPLRERLDDLPVLVEHLMVQALGGDTARARALVAGMDAAQWERLRRHRWRGNVRELRNVVERSLALSVALGSEGLSHSGVSRGPGDAPRPSLDAPFLEERQRLVERFEADYLQGMLQRHQGNFSRAAAAAGIDRMYFKRLLKKYGLPRA